MVNPSAKTPLVYCDSTKYDPAVGGAAELVFHISLMMGIAADDPVSIDYATEDVTAIAGEDYTETKGTLTLEPGETTKQIRVPVLRADLPGHVNRTLLLHLANPSACATLAVAKQMGTIVERCGCGLRAWGGGGGPGGGSAVADFPQSSLSPCRVRCR